MKAVDAVKQYWDEFPCGIQISDKDKGTREFFEEIKTKFRDVYAPYTHSDALLNFRAYRDKSVLEVGCGIGLDALEFARNGAHVTAVDLSPKNIELAQAYFGHNNLKAAIEVGDAERLRFGDGTFDLALAIGVLYYTPNTQKAVDELRRVLRPGGKAICMFYNRYSWYVLLARMSHSNLDHEDKDPPVVKLYSVKEVTNLFRQFSHVEVETDRFPTKTLKRSGVIANLYNSCVVPLVEIVPKRMIRPFGFHVIVKATK